jgi:hypothetical protein
MTNSLKEEINVPEDDIGKIKYYLIRVCYCIDYSEMNDYLNSSSLSSDDQQFLFSLCLSLSPDLFIGKVFFPNDKLCSSRKERFCPIDQIGCQSIIHKSLIIDGRTYQIKRIFLFHHQWLNQYYLDPMNRLKQRFRPQRQRSKKYCSII